MSIEALIAFPHIAITQANAQPLPAQSAAEAANAAVQATIQAIRDRIYRMMCGASETRCGATNGLDARAKTQQSGRKSRRHPSQRKSKLRSPQP